MIEFRIIHELNRSYAVMQVQITKTTGYYFPANSNQDLAQRRRITVTQL